jgi:hypothetical protein
MSREYTGDTCGKYTDGQTFECFYWIYLKQAKRSWLLVGPQASYKYMHPHMHMWMYSLRVLRTAHMYNVLCACLYMHTSQGLKCDNAVSNNNNNNNNNNNGLFVAWTH